MSGSIDLVGETHHPFATLLDLGRKARHAGTLRELEFLAVNETHALAPYRQAALWVQGEGVRSLSGIVQVEANVPYVLWLKTLCEQLAMGDPLPRCIDATSVSGSTADEWEEWLPAHALWLPLTSGTGASEHPEAGQGCAGGLLLAREAPWSATEIALLDEWLDIWAALWRTRHRPRRQPWRDVKARLRQACVIPAGQRWWKAPAARWLAAVVLVLGFPVRLTVLAPGELVPANPAVIRSPLDGVVDTFHVQPNQPVTQGQPLFGFDESLIQSRLEVSRQTLATAEAEYRQAAQQALTDARSKAQLALLTGKIEEKRAELTFLSDQLQRARVLAPQAGIALFDDPSEWIGRPVTIGERILRIAAPGDAEVEAWVPLADAIPLPEAASVNLYLNASPLSPVAAEVRYLSHEAFERPDGSYAYRLRARLTAPTDHRVGLKGMARIQGHWVPMIYWVLRRPLASIRTYLGW